jgi:hypothetical protein
VSKPIVVNASQKEMSKIIARGQLLSLRTVVRTAPPNADPKLLEDLKTRLANEEQKFKDEFGEDP